MPARSRSSLPNLLSAARILLMPTALTAALAGSKPWFVTLLAVALATDAIDGFIARWLRAESDFGRKLDSAADYLTLLLGLAGIALLWPDIMHRELPWVAAGLTMFFAVIVFGLIRYGRVPCHHTWATKILNPALCVSLLLLLNGITALPFRLIVLLQIIAAMEQLAITCILSNHTGEVSSFWHALKMRPRAERQKPLSR